MKNKNRLWPVRGGTWNERWIALGYVLQLALLVVASYWLAWSIAPFFKGG